MSFIVPSCRLTQSRLRTVAAVMDRAATAAVIIDRAANARSALKILEGSHDLLHIGLHPPPRPGESPPLPRNPSVPAFCASFALIPFHPIATRARGAELVRTALVQALTRVVMGVRARAWGSGRVRRAMCEPQVEGAADAPAAAIEDVGVDHGRGHVAVAEELLDGADVIAGLQEVCGE